jgi:hypothetical protein
VHLSFGYYANQHCVLAFCRHDSIGCTHPHRIESFRGSPLNRNYRAEPRGYELTTREARFETDRIHIRRGRSQPTAARRGVSAVQEIVEDLAGKGFGDQSGIPFSIGHASGSLTQDCRRVRALE